MGVIRTPYYHLLLDGADIDDVGIRDRISSVSFTEDIDQVDELCFTIDLDGAVGSPEQIEFGNRVNFAMGYYPISDDANEYVFDGYMEAFDPVFGNDGMLRLAVICHDWSGVMDVARQPRVFEDKTVREVLEEIAQDYRWRDTNNQLQRYSVVMDNFGEAVETAYEELTKDQFTSDREFLLKLARKSEKRLVITRNEIKLVNIRHDSEQRPSLVYAAEGMVGEGGIPLTMFRPKTSMKKVAGRIIVVGEPEQVLEPVAGNSIQFIPLLQQGNAPKTIGYNVALEMFGERTIERIDADGTIRNSQDAANRAIELNEEKMKRFCECEGELKEGDQALRIGQRRQVEIAGFDRLGRLYSTDYEITGTIHTIDRDSGYSTKFSGRTYGLNSEGFTQEVGVTYQGSQEETEPEEIE